METILLNLKKEYMQMPRPEMYKRKMNIFDEVNGESTRMMMPRKASNCNASFDLFMK
jgi:hypothetical protein